MRTVSTSFSPAESAERQVSVLDRALQLVSRFVQAVRHRATLSDLTHFDEHMLRDIGLNRSDVLAALDAPIGQDPSERLASTVRQRRASRSALQREAKAQWN